MVIPNCWSTLTFNSIHVNFNEIKQFLCYTVFNCWKIWFNNIGIQCIPKGLIQFQPDFHHMVVTRNLFESKKWSTQMKLHWQTFKSPFNSLTRTKLCIILSLLFNYSQLWLSSSPANCLSQTILVDV